VTVGYKLYREVRDFAPADLTSGELVVAMMIADDARDSSRRSWISNAELCYQSRLTPSAVRAALAKLAARGYEFRIPRGIGKDGRPVFAAKGHAADYIVPDFLKGATTLAPLPVDNPREGATAQAPMARGPVSKGASAVPEGASPLAAIEPQRRLPASAPPLKEPNPPSENPSATPDTAAVTPPVEGNPAPVDNGRPKRTEAELMAIARNQVTGPGRIRRN